jgi:hypothetical protein
VTGSVRLRSNVVIIRNDDEGRRARASLPGEVAADTLSMTLMTPAQMRERSLYNPCITCLRSLWRIARQGCRYDCAALRRAMALQDVEQTYRAARAQNARQVDEAAAEIPSGRGLLEPIPEWHPHGKA